MAQRHTMPQSNGYVVIVNLEPKPLPSVGLDKRFTRIDYTAMCTMRDVLDDMSRVLKVDSADLTLEAEDGTRLRLEETLADYYKRRSGTRSLVAGTFHHRPSRVKCRRREINLKVRHTPPLSRRVTCVVGGDEDPATIRSTTVRHAAVEMPNTATFRELLESARSQPEALLGGFGYPVYGRQGELEVSLREAWVRDGCRVDHRFHVGRVVVVHPLNGTENAAFSFVMGPGDTIGDVKKRICEELGIGMSRQSIMIRGVVQGLEDRVGLTDCCVAGDSIGGFPPEGWGELHLELCVEESAFLVDSCLKEAYGKGGWKSEANVQKAEGVKPPDHPNSDSRTNVTRNIPTVEGASSWPPEQALSPLLSGGSDVCDAFLSGSLNFATSISTSRRKGVDCRQSTVNGSCTIVIFALSPSGRALTLRVRQDAKVSDAKELIALDEGVPVFLQRLLWRGSALEPDVASLYTLGVRSGDTLILGYRIPRGTVRATETPGGPKNDGDTIGSSKRGADECPQEEVRGRKQTASGESLAVTGTAETLDGVGRAGPPSDGRRSSSMGGANAPDRLGNGDTADSSGTRDNFVPGGNCRIPPDSKINDRDRAASTGLWKSWPFARTRRERGVSDFTERESLVSGAPSSAAFTSSTINRRITPMPMVMSENGIDAARVEYYGTSAPPSDEGSRRAMSVPLGGRVKLPGWTRWKHGRRRS